MFSPQLTEVALTEEEIKEHRIVSDMALEFYRSINEKADHFSLEPLFYLFILDEFLQTSEMSLEEGKHLFNFLKTNYNRFQDKNAELFFYSQHGSRCLFLSQ